MDKVINKKQSLLFTMKPLSFEKMGEKLIRVSCYLLGCGINRNGSNITKEAIIKANEKLAHLPVVGHLIQDENGDYYMGGHDVKIEDKGRDWSIEPLTVALGCIAGDKKFEFVTLKEFEGTEKEQKREYLKVDMIIWNHMSPVFEAAYSQDVYFNHSIEIDNVDGLWDATNNFRIDSFEYDRACLLGLSDDYKKHVEPCFPESKVYPTDYSLDSDLNKQFTLLIQEIKRFNTSNDVLNIQNNSKKEDDNLNKETKILFSEVCAKIKDVLAEKVFTKDATNKQYSKYSIQHINEADNTVTVIDRESDYTLAYKLSYVASQIDDGVKVSIDFENKTDMVIGVVEKADAIFNVKNEIELMVKDAVDFEVNTCKRVVSSEYQSKIDEAVENYELAKEEIADLKKHLSIFESEKKAYMEQKHKEVIDTLLSSKREDMGKYSEFLEYCLNDNYSKSVETVEKELKEIHYNYMVKTARNPKNKAFSAIETNVIESETSGVAGNTIADRYGEDIAKYFK